MNRPGFLCFEATMGFSYLPPPFLLLHFPFIVLQVFGMERQKKTYSYAFLLVIVNELGCTNRELRAEISHRSTSGQDGNNNPPPPTKTPPQANLENSILVHKFLNV